MFKSIFKAAAVVLFVGLAGSAQAGAPLFPSCAGDIACGGGSFSGPTLFFSTFTINDTPTVNFSMDITATNPADFGSLSIYSYANNSWDLVGLINSVFTISGNNASISQTFSNVADGVYGFGIAGFANGSGNFTYEVAAVPEPGELGLLLSGFGLMAFIARRRMKNAA